MIGQLITIPPTLSSHASEGHDWFIALRGSEAPRERTCTRAGRPREINARACVRGSVRECWRTNELPFCSFSKTSEGKRSAIYT